MADASERQRVRTDGEGAKVMRAVVMDGFGGPEVLRLDDVPRPTPGRGQVLLKVAATSVNRADLQQRAGHYPPPPGESEVLGLEAAGLIEQLGEGVSGWQVGDRAMTLLGGGAYAEYAVAPAATLLPIPARLDMVQAAGITEVFLTAYLNVFREAALGRGETLLVHGGASGVGTAAIQLAKALGPSRVLVTVGSEAKAAACRLLGADHAILYKQEDFAERVLELTAEHGADVILDHIGAQYLEPNLACLATYGRLVIIGLLGGASAQFNIGRLMVKRQRIIGSVLRARAVEEKAAIAQAFRKVALHRFATGELKPVIHEVLPLEQVRRAHELMAANANIGKVILRVDPTLR